MCVYNLCEGLYLQRGTSAFRVSEFLFHLSKCGAYRYRYELTFCVLCINRLWCDSCVKGKLPQKAGYIHFFTFISGKSQFKFQGSFQAGQVSQPVSLIIQMEILYFVLGLHDTGNN